MTNHRAKHRSPPGHVSREAQLLWRRLFKTYQFDAEASLLLLDALIEAWDRGRQCREELNGKDLTFTDRFGGVRIHPLAVEERACREQTARLARLLRIHIEDADEADDA